MKLICIIIFFTISSSAFCQNLDEVFFESLTENDKKVLLSIYDLKNKENNKFFLKSLDSTKRELGKSHKLYPIVLMLSAEENESRKNLNQAISDYNELITLFPNKKIDFLYRLSILYMYSDKINKSISMLERIIKLKPTDILAYNNLANKYISIKGYSKALKILESIDKDNRNALTDNFFAIVYYHKGEIKRAKHHIDSFLESEYSNESFRGYLIASKIYSKLNNKSKSCEYITKANEYSSDISLNKVKLNKKSILYKNLESDLNEINNLLTTYCN